MSRPTAIAQPPSSPTPGYSGNYRLRSDIAQFCLPGATKDASQKLAYVNSICIFTLAIGFIGIKAPQLVNREPAPSTEIMPVEIVQIQPQTPPEPAPILDEPPPDAPVEMPQIATVVAADPSQVKFAIPVEGPVVFAPARFAEAPPANPPKAASPQPTKFVRNTTDGGYYPDPNYPGFAQRQRMQGSVVLLIAVDPSGKPASVEVTRSSGHPILDKSAEECVRERWRFPPGENRRYEWTCEFRLP